MAGQMQWFQVTCPGCTASLQVRLPEGITSVQCSQCKAVFAVQVQPIALTAQSAAPIGKRSRKRKSDKMAGLGNQPPRALSAYNVFMKGEVARVKKERADLPHREAFKLAAERWQASPMNPQNGGERFPALPAEDNGDAADEAMADVPTELPEAGKESADDDDDDDDEPAAEGEEADVDQTGGGDGGGGGGGNDGNNSGIDVGGGEAGAAVASVDS